MYTPEDLATLAQLRQKALQPGYSIEDMKEYVRIARKGRQAASTAAAASGKGRKKVPVNVDKLFEDLES